MSPAGDHGRGIILLGTILICGIAVAVQFFMREALGWSIDTVLAALLVSALFIGPLEIGILALIAGVIVGLPIVFSLEIAMFIGLPVSLSLIHKKMPWQHLLLALGVVFVGVLLFYAIVNGRGAYADIGLVMKDALLACVFGSVVFASLFSLQSES
ncbi:MAG: hypothetical protein Q7S28_03670 [bacterium]|nr:hypothetical protein [bacterium]